MNHKPSKITPRRLWALIRKEGIQIVTDPSSILIAFILPVMLLFIFGFAVSLDTTRLRIGAVLEERTPESENLLHSLRNSRYLDVTVSFDRAALEREMVAGRLRGLLIIPVNFSRRLHSANDSAPLQVIADGSEPNTANFVQNYLQAAVSLWLQQRGLETGTTATSLIDLETRNWFNPSLESKNYRIRRISFRTICKPRYRFGCNNADSRPAQRQPASSTWKRATGSILPWKAKTIWCRDRSRLS